MSFSTVVHTQTGFRRKEEEIKLSLTFCWGLSDGELSELITRIARYGALHLPDIFAKQIRIRASRESMSMVNSRLRRDQLLTLHERTPVVSILLRTHGRTDGRYYLFMAERHCHCASAGTRVVPSFGNTRSRCNAEFGIAVPKACVTQQYPPESKRVHHRSARGRGKLEALHLRLNVAKTGNSG
eukprot:3268960-Rhodomonas_salina.1